MKPSSNRSDPYLEQLHAENRARVSTFLWGASLSAALVGALGYARSFPVGASAAWFAAAAVTAILYAVVRTRAGPRVVPTALGVSFVVFVAVIHHGIHRTGGFNSPMILVPGILLMAASLLIRTTSLVCLAAAAVVVTAFNFTLSLSLPTGETARLLDLNLALLPLIGFSLLGVTLREREMHRHLQRQSELSDLASFRQDVIADLSHEMRTPLTVLLGAVDDTRKVQKPGSATAELLDEAKRSGMELLQLINDLLELARLDAKLEKVRLSAVQVPLLVHGVVKMAEPYAKSHDLDVGVHPGPQASLLGDQRKLERTLKNLMSNALKFTPAGGKIRVGWEADAGGVTLWVSDTGPGIPEAERELVFRRFRQLESGAARRYGGTGIGLALVREHVELHAGRVWIEDNPGGGTRVQVWLPHRPELASTLVEPTEPELDALPAPWTEQIVEDPVYQSLPLSSAAERREGSIGGARRPAPGRILIVDDTPAILRLLERRLTQEHDVISARSGREAIELARKLHPSIIVSDMMMPEMDGAELCRRLGRNQKTATIPVVLLTAETSDATRLAARQAGAVAFLTKPVSEEELVATVQSILRKRAETVREVAHYEARTTALVAEGIAHEIRNPLGFVVNAHFLLGQVGREALAGAEGSLGQEGTAALRATFDEALASGKSGIERIRQMVDQIAALGEDGPGRGECDPAAVAAEVQQLVRPKLGKHKLEVEVQRGQAAIAPGPLHDVLLNLVKNALDALTSADLDGTISIQGRVGDGVYDLHISDDGPGIPEDDRTEVFQPFFTTKAPGEGTGLGLAVSRQKVTEYGGSLDLRPTKTGTAFDIRVPLVGYGAAARQLAKIVSGEVRVAERYAARDR